MHPYSKLKTDMKYWVECKGCEMKEHVWSDMHRDYPACMWNVLLDMRYVL